MNLTQEKIARILVAIAAAIFMCVFYGRVIFHPNDYAFGNQGDGLKNYYTFTYHIEHDDTFMELEGMNYPYGENVLYTDGHPLLSWIFQTLNIPVDIHVGILNLLMLLAIWLNFLILFQLLLKLKISVYLSIFGALAIGILQPQIFRLTGHYALSYPFAIPLAWLLILKLKDAKQKWKWIALFAISNLVWMFTHAYLGVIVLFFCGAYLFLDSIFQKGIRKVRSIWALFLGVIFPIVYFKLFASLTDQHVERTDNPMGFFDYYSSLDELLIPLLGPMKKMADQWNGGTKNLIFEGGAYLGLWSLIFGGFALLIVLFLFLKKRVRWYQIFSNRSVNIALVASLPVLLFSFSWPFLGNPEWLDSIPVLKQFRATGRFAWVFYYTFTVFALWLIQTFILDRSQNKWISIVLPFILLSLSIYEGASYHEHVSGRITQMKNEFSYEHLDDAFKEALSKIDTSQYQAILPLPFFHYGSENYKRERKPEISKYSFLLSHHTGLPMFGAYLTRVSIPESKNIIQMMGPDIYPKAIEKDLRMDKKMLIIESNEDLSYHESNMSPVDVLFENDLFKLKVIDPRELFEMDFKSRELFSQYLPSLDSLLQDEKWHSLDSSAFIVMDFEEFESDVSFFGMGSLSYGKSGNFDIATVDAEELDVGEKYVLSVWMRNKGKDVLNQWFDIRTLEKDNENDKWIETIYYPETSEVIWGDWTLAEFEFEKHFDQEDLLIQTRGRQRSEATIVIDELMIRNKNSHLVRRVIRDGEPYFNANNHWMSLNENYKKSQ